MIIGFAGKKQHGKDTAVKMWEFIKQTHGVESFEDYKLTTGLKPVNLKFADKLKDILCMLTGCTREQLEDDNFKNSYMDDVWNLKKSFVGDYHQFNNKFRGEKYIPGKCDFNVNEDVGIWRYEERLTYRDALQLIGTDALRFKFHPDTWVNATMIEAKNLDYQCFISDVRFPNEVEAIEKSGGIVIRVECTDKESLDNHPSETALDNWTFQYKVAVPLGLENLYNSLKQLYSIL